jgi:ribose transport system permease protein
MRQLLTQERIVLALSALLMVGFSLFLKGFATTDNILALVRSVSVLGILGIGMAVVIIGRGIDLSAVAVMAVSVAWVLSLAERGMSFPLAMALGFGFALLAGLVTGLVVAFVEVPPLFATLAIGLFVYGLGRTGMVPLDVIYLPPSAGEFEFLGKGQILDLPMPILLFAAMALLASLFLRKTKLGRAIYAIGDNQSAARITGLPVKITIVLQYLLSSLVAFIAGAITAAAVSSMNTRVVNSTLIYDVILVVVLGGVGLSGGKGSIRNVIAGTLLIGTLLNGMTIMDVQYTAQNIAKSLILLLAIVIDTLVNPRDVQTGQQGDI